MRSELDTLSTAELIASAPHAYMILTRDHVVHDVNPPYLRLLGLERSDLIGKRLQEIFPDRPDDLTDAVEALGASIDKVFATGVCDEMDVFRQPLPMRGRPDIWIEAWWAIRHSPILRGGEVVGVLQFGENVTSTMYARRDRNLLDRLVAGAASVADWSFTPETGAATASEALANMYDLPWSGLDVDPQPYFDRYHPEDAERVRARMFAAADLPTRTPFSLEHRIVLPGGDVRWVATTGEVTRRNEHDPATIIGIAVDATASRAHETELTRTLEERDALLRHKEQLLADFNHRIRNSLQIVSSLLSLDLGFDDNPATHERMQSAMARVQAIASVHELIYRSGQVATVDVAEYLPDLCHSLAAMTSQSVAVESDTEELVFSTDRAISLAILTSELVRASFRRSRGDDETSVWVALKSDSETLELSVSSGGEVRPGDASVLEGRIIGGMVSQLDAEMHRSGKGDARVTRVRVPIEVPA